jgi:hypothetical protein
MAEEYAPGSFTLSRDSLTGTLEKMHITNDQKLIFESTVEIDGVAEKNKFDRDSISRNERLPDGMVRVASLPMLIYQDLKQRGILDDKAALRKWLKSEEARPFRTHWVAS